MGLVAALLSWFLAQVSKLFIYRVCDGKWSLHYMTASGGMPSSHAASVCSLTTVILYTDGINSSVFALSAVVACVVMYDACNVRRSVGEQTKVLNQLTGEDLLKEVLGHTPFQVLIGALLGIVVGTVTCMLL